jgi:hypothetical protein
VTAQCVLNGWRKGKNDRVKVLIVEFNGTRFKAKVEVSHVLGSKAKLEVSHVLGSQVNTSRFIISDLLKSQLGVVITPKTWIAAPLKISSMTIYTYQQRTRHGNDPAPIHDPVARAKKKWYSFPSNIQLKEKGQKAKVE